jgi:hypothetical protein
MTLKITTPDIQLEYTDDYSKLEENAKKYILEIINQMYMHQSVSDKPQRILASEFFGELKNNKL